MKKYSNDHLESVPVEYIQALETFLKKVAAGEIHSDCPTCYANGELDCDWTDYTSAKFCPVYFGYVKPGKYNCCPCNHYNSATKAKAAGLNLIKQWKRWAGVEK